MKEDRRANIPAEWTISNLGNRLFEKRKKQIYLLCENGGLGASSLGFTNKELVHVSGVEKKKEEKPLKAEF